ncbi:BTB/POZ domain-containing protein KCTD12-like [Saccoglossus kowalevskii]|uniref:BTB/POZ domain-containing protein KCTD12-like n=1 Tax=Saccoglossus kowalevskii TaxID=10224 RepID=A0ABM0M4G5_SACKO|nr:PREDICTED: BTB/POZ domain-containing protein KCTD12-like [Saccoglossus kowalevskii]
MTSSSNNDTFPSILELNVGGQLYTTALSTLVKETDSLLGQMFSGSAKTGVQRDSRGRYFIDRDGILFRYILDYLRNSKLVLPENFTEKERLRQEAEFYKLGGLVKAIARDGGAVTQTGRPTLAPINNTPQNHVNSVNANAIGKTPAYITLGYRGTFAFGRDGLADVKFRKVTRILVCGKQMICKEIFGETLNDSRDPDRVHTSDRYSSRYFLKHNYLEQAFDMLAEGGFRFVSCCASGTSTIVGSPESEESKWNHYNEFVFQRS